MFFPAPRDSPWVSITGNPLLFREFRWLQFLSDAFLPDSQHWRFACKGNKEDLPVDQ
jgi:hypothetical protein